MAGKKRATSSAAEGSGGAAPELGHSGLRESGGWLREERLAELQGRRGKEKFREMSERNAIIGSCLGYTTSLIKAMTYRVEPASTSDPEEARQAAFAWDCLNDMSSTWGDFLDEALSMAVFGFAPHEIVYKRRLGWSNDGATRSKYSDGMIGLRKLPLRGQETVVRWKLDPNGGIQGFWQRTERTAAFIPIERLLLLRTSSVKNNPEGRSLLRSAYEAYYYSVKLAELEAVGFERDATGIPVFHLPAACFQTGATTDQKATLAAAQEIVKNIKMDNEQGLVIPSAFDPSSNQELYKIELLTTGGKKAFDAGEMITRWEQRMAMAMLSDFVLLGHEKVGSYALSHDKTSLYALALEALAEAVCKPVNAYLMPRLMAINGWDPARCPKLTFVPIEDVNLSVLGGLVQVLTNSGMPMFQELEDRLLQLADLPLRPEPARGVPAKERRPLKPAPTPPPAPASSGRGAKKPAPAAE